jgi:hypothetical protein
MFMWNKKNFWALNFFLKLGYQQRTLLFFINLCKQLSSYFSLEDKIFAKKMARKCVGRDKIAIHCFLVIKGTKIFSKKILFKNMKVPVKTFALNFSEHNK